MGLSRTGKVSWVSSTILHHEDTKGTKKQDCDNTAGGSVRQADRISAVPTNSAIKADVFIRPRADDQSRWRGGYKDFGWDPRQAAPDVPWSQITAIRNRLIHAYFEIDPNILWKTADEEVPALRSALLALIENQ